MAKSKLATPAWILEGYDSPKKYNEAHGIKSETKKVAPKKGSEQVQASSSSKSRTSEKSKKFKVRKCPKCGSYNVGVVISGQEDLDFEDEEAIPEGKTEGDWECKDCKWKGRNVKEEELNEEQFMKYLDEKGEEVA